MAIEIIWKPRRMPAKTDYTVHDVREEAHRQRKADRKNGPYKYFRMPHGTRVRRA